MHKKITLVMNSGSGHDDKAAARDMILQRLQEAGVEARVVEIAAGKDIPAACLAAASDAKQDGSLVVAAGGDGTVNCLAAACVQHDVPMGIIPMGTFNYFARDLGIEPDIETAVAILTMGQITSTAVGMLQNCIFINNASFGTYTRIVKNREKDKAKFGRYRIVALLSEIRSLYAPAKVFTVRVGTGDTEKTYRTTMIFAGINKIQLENLGLARDKEPGREKMSVTVMKPVTRLQMTRILLRGLFRQLPEDERIDVFYTDSFTVEAAPGPIPCVVDGEIVKLAMPLSFKLMPDALRVMTPAPKADA